MPTIADMQAAKRKLEWEVLMAVKAFEDDYGVTVAFIGSTHSQELCGRPQTVNVRVDVKI